MEIFIKTNRLILREILPTDVGGMLELDSDPEVHRYLGDEPVCDREQIIEVINFIRQQYIDNGIGRWAVIDRKTNQFIGWAGLKFVTETINGHSNYYDLGYRIIRKCWNKGFATEAAIALLNYAFETLNVDAVYAWVDSDNIASNRVLEKAGLKFMEKFDFDGIIHNWYRIERTN
jgi:ribosomal-protein-alanine N-acetyltransferase